MRRRLQDCRATALLTDRATRLIACCLILAVAGCSAEREAPPSPDLQPRVWGREGSGPGQFKGPRAVAVHPGKYLYVADRASRISKWTLQGKFLRNWIAPVTRNGRFEGPEGLAVLANGDLVVTNTHAARVLIYSPEGKLKKHFGSYGTKPGQFLLVTGVCTDAENFIYTADYGGHFDRISKWTSAGRLVATWTGHGEGPRQFRRPSGLAISAAGDLLVADIANHRIQILDRHSGAYKGTLNRPGRNAGELTYPYGVAVDGQGRIHTVEYSLHRVQLWSPSGAWLGTWGGPGRQPGELANPWGIALDEAGWVYVADTNNNRIQKFRFPANQGVNLNQ